MKRLSVLIAAVVLLAACSSSKPSATTAPPPTTNPTTSSQPTASTYTAADRAACQAIDQHNADLLTLDQQLHAGTAEAFGIGLPIMGASDGVAGAFLASPDAAKIKPDATAFSDALKTLDKKVTSGAATIDASSELSAVERDWKALSSDCSAAGYTMVNVPS